MLIYRSVWADKSEDLSALLLLTFGDWARNLGFAQPIPLRGTIEDDRFRLEVQRGDAEFGQALRVSLNYREQCGALATTFATAIKTDDEDGYLWVETERDGNLTVPAVDTSRLVFSLLRGGDRPHRQGVGLRTDPARIYSHQIEKYANLVARPHADVAVLLLSDDVGLGITDNDIQARRAAEMLSGAALVLRVDVKSEAEFNSLIPMEYRVRPGEAKLFRSHGIEGGKGRSVSVLRYQKGGGEPWADTLLGAWAAAQLVSEVVPMSPPPGWANVKLLLERSGATSTATESEDFAALQAIYEDELREVRQRLDAVTAELIDSLSELETVQAERDSWKVAAIAVPVSSSAVTEPDSVAPPESIYPSEVFAWAEPLLHMVVIHPEAGREVHRLDSARQAMSWGRDTCRALLALERYAVDAVAGLAAGFWDWCSKSGLWPLDKIAMSESETVRNDSRLAGCRLLPIDSQVVSSGQVHMWAHLKITKGGSSNIPRLYFFDDTGGSSMRVHIGFYGPHDLMPNTKS